MTHVTGEALPDAARRKVTLLVSHLAPAFGMERVALATAKLLAESYDVEVICIGGSEADHRVHPDARLLGGPLRGWRRVVSLWRIWRLARKLQTDTVVLAGVWVALPWLALANTRKFNSVVWEHSLLKQRATTSIQMRILAGGARRLYRRSESIVAVSAPLKRDVEELTGEPVEVIPNTVETPPDEELVRSSRTGEDATIRLITVGSLTRIKSQQTAIRALTLLDERYVLTVVGAGPLDEELRDLVGELGLSGRVDFAGFLEEERLRDELSDAHLMVHCAQVETFGLVYVEAANVGLPVVSTASDVAYEMIPSLVPGWVCNSDPESLANEIFKRSQESLPQQELLEAAARRREAFSAESVRKQWQQTIDRI